MSSIKKLTGAVAAIALVLTTIITFAFTNSESKIDTETTLYHYNGNYVLEGALPIDASCGGAPTLPCSITVQDVDLPPSYPTIPDEEIDNETFEFEVSGSNGTYTN